MARKLKSIQDQSQGVRLNFIALKHLPRFVGEVRAIAPRLFFSNFVIRLLSSVFPIAMLYVGKLIIDQIVILYDQGISDQAMKLLWWYVATELILVILSDIADRITSITDGLLGDKYSIQSSVRLIMKTSEVELYHLEDPVFYDKLERARQQTTGRVSLLSNVLSQLQDLITIIQYIAALVIFEPWLILLLILSVIPAFINDLKFSSMSYSLSRSWTAERRELDYLRYIGANDKTAKELKLFGLANFLANRFSQLSYEYYQVNKQLSVKRGIYGTIFSLLGTIAYYGAYVLIIFRVIHKALTIGDLSFLSGSFNRLQSKLSGTFRRFTQITNGALGLKDYYEFLDLKVIKSELETLELPNAIRVGFRFDQVTFAYPGSDRNVIEDLSFEIKAGEKIAFVGENGAGKTTLIKLLLRFYEPTSGTIYLDNNDIRRFDKAAYQKYFGVIFQDFVKYEFDVKENIGVGNVLLINDEDKINEAAENSLADQVIKQLPEGLEQQLGKRFNSGIDLSGGQWQKIALARAYMKDAPVVILDEPTSALDAKAEFEAFERFMGLTKNKTSIIISHRFSTVRLADIIMVLKDGKVHEMGSHQFLMQQNGLYAELFNLQAKAYQD